MTFILSLFVPDLFFSGCLWKALLHVYGIYRVSSLTSQNGASSKQDQSNKKKLQEKHRVGVISYLFFLERLSVLRKKKLQEKHRVGIISYLFLERLSIHCKKIP